MGADVDEMTYVATFYTHFSALVSRKSLVAAGVQATLAPVPRALSASCGTCVFYVAEQPHLELLDKDVEQVAVQSGDGYRLIHQNA